jgi:hypothetical protein|tara:strand:+ start:1117 stop:1275 length:159 start_codon:yes stop_codon:yes gene_type:complete
MPDGKDGGGGQCNVGIVELMVVGNPVPDESPECFHVGISSNTGDLLWFATYT